MSKKVGTYDINALSTDNNARDVAKSEHRRRGMSERACTKRSKRDDETGRRTLAQAFIASAVW